MQVNVQRLRRFIQEFDFKGILIEELGWDHHQAMPLIIPVDGQTYTLNAIAEKHGFVVYVCEPDTDGGIPATPVRRKIGKEATKTSYQHMVIFADAAKTTQMWLWIKRQEGKPNAPREHVYHSGQPGELLVQRLRGLAFDLQEEEDLSNAIVAGRVRQAMDVERLTRRFYDRFRKEHQEFLLFIKGIQAQADREWYASLMLNRMMFIYFIQKRGFLDGDINYLRNRLQRMRQSGQGGRFQQFYRLFLLRLFHEGLGQPEDERAPELTRLLGRVPYLNGGLFDIHDLERDNPDIEIPDEAFEKVFDFFDAYNWSLDDRPQRPDNEINPDVLGYIFEKYINQKQMGAYYTKEDITGYISRNTVIPYLFDAARKECPIAFQPGGGVWRLLIDDPDRYIYEAVKKGVELPLPDDIAAGLNDVSRRDSWNRPAPEEYALPTEIWREVVARRKRYEETRLKLANGEVQDINELVTLNLDICRFAEDVIVHSEGTELVRAFWKALRGISVLDPTCGSGAFLFAALNMLEPLYRACLESMEGFLNDLDRSERKHHPDALRDFREVLKQVETHPSPQYFMLKSIVINNLYGVDIMREAVEICKLRLFLKLVAQVEKYDEIEPLPDIDFNIRAGNTLVGFTSLDAVRNAITATIEGQGRMLMPEDEDTLKRINEDAEIADRAFKVFREMQTKYDMDADQFATAKVTLRERLDKLRDELDLLLAGEYGVDSNDESAYEQWRESHLPFHWFVEFYGIMSGGGFNVIIGNPPWREYSSVKKEYQVRDYETETCGNLYALCSERSIKLASQHGWFSFIVQLPFVSSSRMAGLRKLLLNQSEYLSYIPFDDRPGKLFDGLQHCRSVVFLTQKQIRRTECSVYSSKYQRWATSVREYLFYRIEFVHIPNITVHQGILPKVAAVLEDSLLAKLLRNGGQPVSRYIRPRSTNEFVFYQEAMQYWAKATYELPYYAKNGVVGAPPHGRYVYTGNSQLAHCICAIINSSLFYIYFIAYSDCFHLSDTLVRNFPVFTSIMEDADLVRLNQSLMEELHRTAERKTINTRDGDSITYEEFFAGGSKQVIDEIDRVLARHYSFTDEELDFIINYDLKYRLGRDIEEE